MSLSFTVFCVLSSLLLGYYYVKRKYGYWKDRGVPYMEPKFPLGNAGGVSTKICFGEMMMNCYDELKGKGPVGGIYLLTEPSVVILDVDLLRNVYVKDFQYFHDRGTYVNERDDPLSAHLFSLEGAQWRSLRAKLSPTFTSGKMKMMHSTLLMVADQFRDHLRDVSGGSVKEVEFRELLAQFSTDVIGNVAFGLECNSMKDPNSQFRNIGRKIVEPSTKQTLTDIFTTMFPKISRTLRIKSIKPEVTEFFFNMLGDTVKYREENNVQRNDFLSLLIQIKNEGKLDGEETELGKLTFNELAAQVFLFFLAGFETSSGTMSFALYELALNQDLQQKAREEVMEVAQQHGGILNYEAAMELRFIDQIIHGKRHSILISSLTMY